MTTKNFDAFRFFMKYNLKQRTGDYGGLVSAVELKQKLLDLRLFEKVFLFKKDSQYLYFFLSPKTANEFNEGSLKPDFMITLSSKAIMVVYEV